MAKTTTVRLPSDFDAVVDALLRTPPPPAGNPATRKTKPKKKAAKNAAGKRR